MEKNLQNENSSFAIDPLDYVNTIWFHGRIFSSFCHELDSHNSAQCGNSRIFLSLRYYHIPWNQILRVFAIFAVLKTLNVASGFFGKYQPSKDCKISLKSNFRGSKMPKLAPRRKKAMLNKSSWKWGVFWQKNWIVRGMNFQWLNGWW